MASTAALYRIPEQSESAKTRAYSLDELRRIVYYSGAPHSVRNGTLAALEARGEWPRYDGPATPILCISLRGMMQEGGCCRRTAQRRVKRALALGYWRRTRGLNSWLNCPKCGAERKTGTCGQCKHKGDSHDIREYVRPFTYELDVEKFIRAPRCREIHSVDWRTYAEYKAAAQRGEHPNVTEMPARKPAQPSPQAPLPPAPAAPSPKQPQQPAAEHRSNRRGIGSREHERKRELSANVIAEMTALMRRGKSQDEALCEVCLTSGLAAHEVQEILKLCLFRAPKPVPQSTSPPNSCATCGGQRFVLNLSNKSGEKRLIPCPACGDKT